MLIRSLTPADIPAAAALLRRAADRFILLESSPENAVAFLAEHDAALGPGHAGVFTVNASNVSVPFYAALGFERTAPMQVAQVSYNPMRLVDASAGTRSAAGGAALVDPA